VAVAAGLLTLAALLGGWQDVANLLLGWAAFLAAAALLLGVFNLFSVHWRRYVTESNYYSGLLLLGAGLVGAMAVTDALAVTDGGVALVFNWIQAPLEAALASLLVFLLLLAGFRLLQRDRGWASILFLATVIGVLLADALSGSRLLPEALAPWLDQARAFFDEVVVTAGMRGILIGVALGTLTLGIRILAGWERPYDK
jgi:hypothetical protein